MALKVISCDFLKEKKQKQANKKAFSVAIPLSNAGYAYEHCLSTNCAAFSTGHGTRKSIEGGVQDDPECLSPSSPLWVNFGRLFSFCRTLQHESDPLVYSKTVT